MYALRTSGAWGLSTVVPFVFAFLVVSALLATALPKTRKSLRQRVTSVSEDCPYEYILNVYGRNHFAGFVRKLSPLLEAEDPKKWRMVLEIMDGVHFCLILVDDVR